MNWKAFGFPCEQNNNSNKRLLICFDSILAYLAFSCEAKHVNLTRSTFCKTITRFKAYKGRDSEIKDFIHGTVDEQHRLINFVFLKRICFKIKKGLSCLRFFLHQMRAIGVFNILLWGRLLLSFNNAQSGFNIVKFKFVGKWITRFFIHFFLFVWNGYLHVTYTNTYWIVVSKNIHFF